ncbi:MAG: hypothetical protein Q4A92_02530, partial [Corynebacterium sp.]|nr:hypothetical protein [Corynebacterium sp.]
IKAPTRVLAKYAGREVLEVAMASAEAWVEEAYSLSDSGQISEHKINVYDPNVWAFFHQTRALVRAILCNGTGSTYSSIFTVGSLVGESVELECVVSSELMLVHPRDLRNISVVGYTH